MVCKSTIRLIDFESVKLKGDTALATGVIGDWALCKSSYNEPFQ